MRRLAAALLATTLLLTGCSGGSDTPDAPDASQAPATNAFDGVTVEGDLGAAPTVTFDQPFSVDEAVAQVETEGTGETLAAGQQLKIDYIALSGDDGTPLGSTWELGAPDTLSLGDETILPALTDVLLGQKIGVRVLFAAPGGEAVAATDTAPATEAYPATLMVIEVVGVAPGRAEGAAVEPPAGLPTVTLAENGEPEIEVPADAVEPTELVVQPLIKGDGAAIATGDAVTVHYKGWLWDGTLFDSSWNGQPFPTPIGSGQLIAGWDEGLVGQTVGSQVLLVVPADKGYGAEGNDTIPPNATLIFVIDILEAG
ncbi:FKBP-type peptidyl-prolyl cis-trans isomerase [Cellulomonas sp. KRMCY2]|uniref:FKBP-type peptidyl-prolyl cis-trans isomerase n=1 Tax=Cellulomonas sp. KRMCY2 TaxID=1304865 RepID=UPI00045E8170|nr:FKBP-type peptidyl-prolyl cis-trans isomerase [Cellulomonas sp. KRMCY2]